MARAPPPHPPPPPPPPPAPPAPRQRTFHQRQPPRRRRRRPHRHRRPFHHAVRHLQPHRHHHDGNHQIGPRPQLQEGRPPRQPGRGQMYRHQHLARPQPPSFAPVRNSASASRRPPSARRSRPPRHRPAKAAPRPPQARRCTGSPPTVPAVWICRPPTCRAAIASAASPAAGPPPSHRPRSCRPRSASRHPTRKSPAAPAPRRCPPPARQSPARASADRCRSRPPAHAPRAQPAQQPRTTMQDGHSSCPTVAPCDRNVNAASVVHFHRRPCLEHTPFARAITPMVARPPSPRSGPKTSRNRSDMPDETLCTSVNSGVQTTKFSVRTMDTTRSSDPTACRIPPSTFTPHCRAAA